MKSIAVFFLVLLLPLKIFSQTKIQTQIENIENLKREYIELKNDSTTENAPQRRAIRKQILNIYSDMENSTFTENTNGKNLTLEIKDYNIEKQGWNISLNCSIVEGYNLFNREFVLPYNYVTKKQFVDRTKMNARQIKSYENLIETYDELFRSSSLFLGAQLTFKITKWLDASEYIFTPESCTIFILGSTSNQIIYTFSPEELEPVQFTILPQIEIRSEAQIRSDREQLTGGEKIYEEEEESENKTEQKGRRTFVISMEYKKEGFSPSDFYYKNLKIDNAGGTLTWGLNDYTFAGLLVNYNIKSINSTSIYEIGAKLGANYSITNFMRPYADGTVSIQTDNKIFLKAGAGIDFKISHFMINFAYDYNWRFNFEPIFDSNPITNIRDVTVTKLHSFSVGIGLSW